VYHPKRSPTSSHCDVKYYQNTGQSILTEHCTEQEVGLVHSSALHSFLLTFSSEDRQTIKLGISGAARSSDIVSCFEIISLWNSEKTIFEKLLCSEINFDLGIIPQNINASFSCTFLPSPTGSFSSSKGS